ncbi:hypothetical protein AVDCRST_MAG84-6194 [uncultured Microcoleus sp.]|uniref:Uncharacterized protein n=1 Tax=uncultured Microcoleus sp. TaxID=259945 RepID=A0A6J4P020_9CYAN|nr:hypothetical protein AVDCRST_MAG84-6194 [uncultured Microcoleus sp.]
MRTNAVGKILVNPICYCRLQGAVNRFGARLGGLTIPAKG